MDSIIYAFLSSLGNTSNSLISTQALRTKTLTAEGVALMSLLPCFILSLVCSFQFQSSMNYLVVLLLIAKNVLYGVAFYTRFRGLSSLGGFQGSLLASSQPIVVSILSLVLLGENLVVHEWLAVGCIALALVLPVKFSGSTRRDILRFAIFPALLLSIVIVIDRWILVHSLKPIVFFVMDKVVLFPVVTLTLALLGKVKIQRGLFSEVGLRKWAMISGLGLTWAIASYTYSISLAGEKTAMVTLIRNLAFPAAAIGSALMYKEKLSLPKFLSLTLMILGCIVAL